jgi:hypothetical protein
LYFFGIYTIFYVFCKFLLFFRNYFKNREKEKATTALGHTFGPRPLVSGAGGPVRAIAKMAEQAW